MAEPAPPHRSGVHRLAARPRRHLCCESMLASVLACATCGAVVLLLSLSLPVQPAAAAQSTTLPVIETHTTVPHAPPITAALKNLATRRTFIVLRAQYSHWSNTRLGRVTKAIVRKWVKEEAKKCPDPLPAWFFCSNPPRATWGRGMAVEINGRWPGEFYSPWEPYDPPRVLRPGYVFWLTCWSSGAEINNGLFRSNLWYRLTNDLWVSDGWLYTGTNDPLQGVARCQVPRP
jgi:hypothetical protein